MPKNEEGEFEFNVGNRQLLSVVFIMFVLFGVMFTLGYFFGRSSSPEPGSPTSAAKAAESPSQPRPEPSQPAAESAAPPAQAVPAEVAPIPGEAKVTAPQTTPVGGAKAEPPAAKPVPATPKVKLAPPPKPSKPPETAKPAVSHVGIPQPGETYLQIAAVKKPEAELIVDVLKKRGFSAMVSPVVAGQPDDALWRALVGPFKDAAGIAKARTDLQAAGFKAIIKRTF